MFVCKPHNSNHHFLTAADGLRGIRYVHADIIHLGVLVKGDIVTGQRR